MKRSIIGFLVLLVLVSVGRVNAAVEFITNGNFEGGFAGAGTSCAWDGLADSLPIAWNRVESFTQTPLMVENSVITGLIPGNGPSAPGNAGVFFQRAARPGNPPNTSGDWTAIQQPLAISVADYQALTLSLDTMVMSHNLVAGGWVAPAFEWPVVAQVDYIDLANNPQTWRFGWYLNPPGDGPPGLAIDPGQGLIGTYNDLPVNPNVWVTNSFNLLTELPQAKTITNVRVGSSGWLFQGVVDNVSIEGAIPEPGTVAVWALLGLSWVVFRVHRRRNAAMFATGEAGPPIRRSWSEQNRIAIRQMLDRRTGNRV